jgi:hypothetical protein
MCWWGQDNVDSTVNTLLVGPVVRFQVKKTEFPILITSERYFERQRFFYPLDNGVPTLRVKLAGREVKHCTFISCQG